MPASTTSLPRWRALIACVAVLLLLLGGCASTGNPRDPLEPVNRAVYQFNDGVDALVIKPAAEFYRAVLPPFVRTGIGNFFSNLNDVIVALNNLLQGKIPAAINDLGRVLVNTTLGVLGVMDPATELGVEKNNEDFGQTLGSWGLGAGPYIVLPFIGPSSLRDTVGWVGDLYSSPVTYLNPNRDRNTLVGIRLVSGRSELLEASQILETAALDPYEYVRDGYLQRRRNQVYDGNPPDENSERGNAKPVSRAPEARLAPPTAETRRGAMLVSAIAPPPTPAEIEARERAVRAAAPATSQPDAGTTAEAPKQARVVRVWLPVSRN